MTRPSAPVVFAGPSLSAADAREVLPDAVLLPPARCGDVLSVLRLRPSAIVLIDGLYDTTPAPWHKEILWALAAGVPVVGASSMGALRAAELDRLGMTGIGRIYEDYRDGRRHSDADVAVLQVSGPDGDRASTDPLVDIEAAVAALAAEGRLSSGQARTALAVARQTHFTERTLAVALGAAGCPDTGTSPGTTTIGSGPPGEGSGQGSQKRADARAALRAVAGGLPPPVMPEPLARTTHILRLAARAALRPAGRPDHRLPAAERALAQDGDLARAAALAGGLIRAADGHPAGGPPAGGHRAGPLAERRRAGAPASRSRGSDRCLEAAARVAAGLGDHPAAPASTARLCRLATAGADEWAEAGEWAGPGAADLREVLAALAGPLGSAALGAVLAGLAMRAAGLAGAPPWGPGAADPSQDAVAEATGLLGPAAARSGDLASSPGVSTLRAAAGLLDLVLLGGRATSRFRDVIDPGDAPLLDGLALLGALGVGPAATGAAAS